MRAVRSLESDIQSAVRAALAFERDLIAWRNNAGVAKGYVRYGLCRGASDLIGIMRPSGRMIALEVKRDGEAPTAEQTEFLATVRAHGGFACVVRSPAEARAAIQRARQGLSE